MLQKPKHNKVYIRRWFRQMKGQRHCLQNVHNAAQVTRNIAGHTSSNSLVVTERAVPKQKVVHAALAASARFKRLENDVAKPLAGEHIASNYRGITIGRKNRPGGNDECHGGQAALPQKSRSGYRRF
jgi:hypothetical protein